MERVNYTEFAGGFNQIVLEESFVLNLKTTMSFVDIPMNFAINENYPLYTPPEIDPEIEPEDQPQYSYRRGRIFFPNMEQVHWNSRIQPYIDPATGGVDYGSIDYFYELDGRYYLAGYWGELDLVSGPPILEIDELKDLPKDHPAKNASQNSESQNPAPQNTAAQNTAAANAAEGNAESTVS